MNKTPQDSTSIANNDKYDDMWPEDQVKKAAKKPKLFEEVLDEILYYLYESSGNSKYIREDHIGKPLNPNEAKAEILKAVAAEVNEALPKKYPDPDAKYLTSGDWDALTAQRAYNQCIEDFERNAIERGLIQ